MIKINGNQLTLDDVIKVARFNEPVTLDPQAKTRMEESWAWVESINNDERPVYGINTGFGIFSDKKISREDTATSKQESNPQSFCWYGRAVTRRGCPGCHARQGKYPGERDSPESDPLSLKPFLSY